MISDSTAADFQFEKERLDNLEMTPELSDSMMTLVQPSRIAAQTLRRQVIASATGTEFEEIIFEAPPSKIPLQSRKTATTQVSFVLEQKETSQLILIVPEFGGFQVIWIESSVGSCSLTEM
ncbi:hypothetical protein V6N13_090746 [Hibiscus sabdariffa]